ncbi:MAG TPA: recombination mediator RecR [Spirochaetota bacterium]|nr:recombination mediator RecR [Spirochaetota bacterium]HOM38106.1 recombination mediator RecR [Spirochaetota bacterium]HPQ48908.1 recombination mediator RecR [Spirochaetota bacterium]
MTHPPVLEKIINNFRKLPGIGPKSAEKIALFLIDSNPKFIKEFYESIKDIIGNIKKCKICFSITTTDTCNICSSNLRNKNTICVVETYKDLIMIENIGEYDGLYHILEGRLSPIKNINPENLRIKELMERIKNPENNIKEVIIATSPNMEGDATGFYIAQEIKKNNINVKITRLAKGLPSGADLEFADRLTLINSLKNREEMKI